ncbi:MAG: glycine cleavage system protein GcvH [Caldiserica bacterium]|nr:glycine cleavage system protein GcvH [Caldisericota bacterium]
MVPQDLLYTESHEWVKVEDGTARVGITDYAQKKLGDVVYVELPDVGKKVKRGDVIVTVESVKAAESVYAPVSGEVREVNRDAVSSPGIINQDPYGKGWLVVIELADRGELEGLLDPAAYAKLVGE